MSKEKMPTTLEEALGDLEKRELASNLQNLAFALKYVQDDMKALLELQKEIIEEGKNPTSKRVSELYAKASKVGKRV